jgi:hypothetical protein
MQVAAQRNEIRAESRAGEFFESLPPSRHPFLATRRAESAPNAYSFRDSRNYSGRLKLKMKHQGWVTQRIGECVRNYCAANWQPAHPARVATAYLLSFIGITAWLLTLRAGFQAFKHRN